VRRIEVREVQARKLTQLWLISAQDPKTRNARRPTHNVEASNRIVTIRKVKPIPLRRTKYRILLSGTCLLRSNEL
jgi:hypothetical protein